MNTESKTVHQIVHELQDKLPGALVGLLPDVAEFELKLEFRHIDGDRKVRSDKQVGKLDLTETSLMINFVPKASSRWDSGTSAPRSEGPLVSASRPPLVFSPRKAPESGTSKPTSDELSAVKLKESLALLVRVLDQAEKRPGITFVPLKKFRDEILLREGITDPNERALLLSDSILKAIVLKGQVANPNKPEYPVTTVRLNRALPLVRAIVGGAHSSTIPFEPRRLACGESLSSTVIRDRR